MIPAIGSGIGLALRHDLLTVTANQRMLIADYYSFMHKDRESAEAFTIQTLHGIESGYLRYREFLRTALTMVEHLGDGNLLKRLKAELEM